MKTIRLENLNTEFMRIRQYVVDLIVRSGNEPQKVPSTRKLAQMFGVSHPTALKVLRNLADDGHLIACGNNGYLTVPGTFGSFEELKIIGLLTGDGSNVLFGLLHFRVSTPFLEEIFGRSGRFSAQHIYLQGNVENAAAIIRNYNLDGIIWFSPDPKYADTIRELRESGLPIVEIGFVTGNASAARWNFVEDHYRIMNRLLDEGRRKPLVLSSGCEDELFAEIQTGIRRSCGEHGVPFDICRFINEDPDSSIRQLRKLLEAGETFDSIMLTGKFWYYWPFLRDHFDVKNKCRVFGGELTLSDDMCFSGCLVTRRTKEAARRLADNFMLQMESPSEAPVSITDIEVDFELYEDGRPVR